MCVCVSQTNLQILIGHELNGEVEQQVGKQDALLHNGHLCRFWFVVVFVVGRPIHQPLLKLPIYSFLLKPHVCHSLTLMPMQARAPTPNGM